MKKILVSLILAITTLCALVVPTFAAVAEQDENIPTPTNVSEEADGTTIVHYDDGSTLTISPVYNVIENDNFSRATSQTTSGNRDAVYKDSDGNLEWKYTLSGTFSYVYGVSSTCTSATYSNNIYASGWTFSDGSATKSGNKAIGKGKYVKKIFLSLPKHTTLT